MPPINKTPSEDEIASTLTHLKLSPTSPQKPAQKPKSKPVADTWDADSSSSDTETELPAPSKASARAALNPISTTSSHEISPHPPPPTPASPPPFEFPDNVPAPRRSGNLDKRPEKTTAVAGRMIAGALGVRAPKRTEEEREFDRVVREKERKRRAEEKGREEREREEVERRKKAVWED